MMTSFTGYWLNCANADDAEFLVAERDGEVIGYLHYDSEGVEPELHASMSTLDTSEAVSAAP